MLWNISVRMLEHKETQGLEVSKYSQSFFLPYLYYLKMVHYTILLDIFLHVACTYHYSAKVNGKCSIGIVSVVLFLYLNWEYMNNEFWELVSSTIANQICACDWRWAILCGCWFMCLLNVPYPPIFCCA